MVPPEHCIGAGWSHLNAVVGLYGGGVRAHVEVGCEGRVEVLHVVPAICTVYVCTPTYILYVLT